MLFTLYNPVFPAQNVVGQVLCSALLPYLLVGPDSYRGADKSFARPGRKQATATEDFEFHISYL